MRLLAAVYSLKTLKMVRILKSDSVIYIKNKCTKDNSILDTIKNHSICKYDNCTVESVPQCNGALL